ncbi:MAG: NifB/NifX family molybdenum-iron cluster-binding protein [Emergencia sp.]
MKIAVTYENGQIYQHFGHCENFKVYHVDNGIIQSSSVENAAGSGHGALAGFLKNLGVDVLICGGIGGGAKVALSEAGIRLFGGVSGEADAAVTALLEDRLEYNANVQCSHHGEHHGDHDCGHQEGHTCGQHTCGR